MGDTNKYGVAIILDTEEDNPSSLSDTLGIDHTEVVIKGEPVKNSKGVAIPNKHNQFNLWIYEISNIESNEEHLDYAIERILDILDSEKERFLNVFKEYPKYKLQCYSYFYEPNPYFALSKELIKRLYEYSLNIEFDIYCLTED